MKHILAPLAVLLFVAAPALADSNIPNITIYARQRAEAAQDVPVSTDFVSRDEVSKNQILDAATLSHNISGFAFNDPFGRYNPSPAIRGMAQPGIGEEPTVAMFQDGLYISGRSSIDSLLFDTDHVEVARGPQNALYGHNAFSGAINFVSRLPGNDPHVNFEQTFATSGQSITSGGIEGAIVKNKLQGRIAAINIDKDGFYKDSTSSTEIGKQQSQGIKATLRAAPDDRTEFILRGSVVVDDDSQPKGFLVAANCEPNAKGSLRQYCGTLPHGNDNTMAADAARDYGFTRDAWRLSAELNRQIDDDMKFTGQFGYASEENTFIRDDDYSAALAQVSGQYNDRRDYNADFRIASDKSRSLWTWLAGTSFYRFENLTQRLDQAVVLGALKPGGARGDAQTQTYAIYGSVGHPIYWGVDLTVEARAQREDKHFESSIVSTTTGKALNFNDNWYSFTPKATLSKHFTPDLMGYVSYAMGQKSGGFNDRASIFDSERLYAPEKNTTYEVGVKSEWWDHRVRANATLFYVDWKDQQVTLYSAAGVTNNFYTGNAARSTAKGVEAQFEVTPIDNLDVKVDYSYTDTRFDEFKDGSLAGLAGFGPLGDVSGNLVPRYSPHQLVVNTDYEHPLDHNAGLNGFVGGTLSYSSAQATDSSNLAWTGDDFKINLRTGIKWKAITATLWVNNLLDDRTPLTGIPWTDATKGYSRAWLVIPDDGRVVGITLKSEFGI